MNAENLRASEGLTAALSGLGFGYPLFPMPRQSPHEKGDTVSEVRETVTLHPETVAKAENLAKKSQSSRRRKRKPKPPDPPVKHRYTKRPATVDKTAWDTALALAGKNPKRIVVESDTTLLVVNHE